MRSALSYQLACGALPRLQFVRAIGAAWLFASLLPMAAQASLQSYSAVYAGNHHPNANGQTLYLAPIAPGVLRTDGTLGDTSVVERSFTDVNAQGELQTESFSGQAKAQAGYGQLRVFANFSLSNRFGNTNAPAFVNPDFSINQDGLPTGFAVASSIYVRDTLTVLAAHTVSFLQLSYRVQGVVSQTGGPLYDTQDNWLWFQARNIDAKYYRGTVDEEHVITLPVVDGTAMLGINLYANAGMYSVFAPHYALDSTGTVDAMNTVTLTDVRAIDTFGQEVALTSVVGIEGFDYLRAAAVPEAPIWLLILGGLPFVATGLRRQTAG